MALDAYLYDKGRQLCRWETEVAIPTGAVYSWLSRYLKAGGKYVNPYKGAILDASEVPNLVASLGSAMSESMTCPEKWEVEVGQRLQGGLMVPVMEEVSRLREKRRGVDGEYISFR